MTSIQRRASILIGASVMVVALLGLNMAFEVAGSIPDIEGCGFLAGSIPALLILFPGIAASLVYSINRFLHRRYTIVPCSLSLGFFTACLGGCVYLGCGLILSALNPSGTIQIVGIGICVLLAVLCGLGGYLGAMRSEMIAASPAWRHGKG